MLFHIVSCLQVKYFNQDAMNYREPLSPEQLTSVLTVITVVQCPVQYSTVLSVVLLILGTGDQKLTN